MKTDSEEGLKGLVTGQRWKVQDVYFQIVDPGARVTYYKVLKRPDQQAALTRFLRTDALLVHLRIHAATLVS